MTGTDKPASNLIIKDINGGFAAQDLGITADVAASSVTSTELYRIETVGDALHAIQYATQVQLNDAGTYEQVRDANGRYVYNDGDVSGVVADGKRIQLTAEGGSGHHRAAQTAQTRPSTSASSTPTPSTKKPTPASSAPSASSAASHRHAQDAQRWQGVAGGVIQIEAGDGTPGQAGTGTTTQIDLTGAETLQEVLDAINATTNTSKVVAEISSSASAWSSATCRAARVR